MLGNQLAICMFFLFKKSELFCFRPPAHPNFEGKPDANQTIDCGLKNQAAGQKRRVIAMLMVPCLTLG